VPQTRSENLRSRFYLYTHPGCHSHIELKRRLIVIGGTKNRYDVTAADWLAKGKEVKLCAEKDQNGGKVVKRSNLVTKRG